MGKLSDFFNKNYVNKLEAIKTSNTGFASSIMGGGRKSVLKGSSMDFSDYRDYVPGDDLRRVDWNAFARFNKRYVKLYNEERLSCSNFFIDISGSMGFGDIKGDAVKALAASMAYLRICSGDHITLRTIEKETKESKASSKATFLNILTFLESIQYAGEYDISECIVNSAKKAVEKGSSYIFSDFYTDSFKDGIMRLKYLKQHVNVIHVLSTEEARPSLLGTLALRDSENNNLCETDLTATALAAYKDELKRHKARIKEFCYKNGVGYSYVEIGEFSEAAVIGCLKQMTV